MEDEKRIIEITSKKKFPKYDLEKNLFLKFICKKIIDIEGKKKIQRQNYRLAIINRIKTRYHKKNVQVEKIIELLEKF